MNSPTEQCSKQPISPPDNKTSPIRQKVPVVNENCPKCHRKLEYLVFREMEPVGQNLAKREILSAFQRFRFEAAKAGKVADYAVFERIYYNCPNTPDVPPGESYLPLPTSSSSAPVHPPDSTQEKKSRLSSNRYRRKSSAPTNAEISTLADEMSSTNLDDQKEMFTPKLGDEFYVGPCTCIECMMKEVQATPMEKTVTRLPARYRPRPATPSPVNEPAPGTGKSIPPYTGARKRGLKNSYVEDIPLYFGNFVTRSPLAPPDPAIPDIANPTQHPVTGKGKGKAPANSPSANPAPRFVPQNLRKPKKKVRFAEDTVENPKRSTAEFRRGSRIYRPGRWSNPRGWQDTSWSRWNAPDWKFPEAHLPHHEADKIGNGEGWTTFEMSE